MPRGVASPAAWADHPRMTQVKKVKSVGQEQERYRAGSIWADPHGRFARMSSSLLNSFAQGVDNP